MKHIYPIFLASLVFLSCSSAPKNEGTVTDIKNQAAEYAGFGNRYYRSADYEQAIKFFTQALDLNTSVDNEKGIVESYNSLGKVYMQKGDFDTAERYFLEAYEMASYLSDDVKLKTAGNLSEYWLIRGDTDAALDYVGTGLEYAAAVPESEEAAVIYHNAGAIYKQLENFDRAKEYVRRALEVNIALSSYSEMAANYYLLSSIASKRGRIDEALENAHLALAHDKMVENSVGIAGDLFALGVLYRKKGNEEEAFRYFEKAYRVYESISLVSGARKTLEHLVESAESLELEDDLRLYTTALELMEQKTQ